jgi:hypothetical protein
MLYAAIMPWAAWLCAVKIPVAVRNWTPFVAILVVWLVLMAFARRRD